MKMYQFLNQNYSIALNGNNYQKLIAPCKTFCLLSELLKLNELDLIKGGSLKNAVVYIDQKVSPQQEKQIIDLFGVEIDYSKPFLSNVDFINENEASQNIKF